MRAAVWVIVLSVFVIGLQAGGSCSTSAQNCDVSCSISAPAGGRTVCDGRANSVECAALNSEDEVVREIVKICPSSGGGGGPDVGYCAIFPFWCIPMY